MAQALLNRMMSQNPNVRGAYNMLMNGGVNNPAVRQWMQDAQRIGPEQAFNNSYNQNPDFRKLVDDARAGRL